MLLKEDFSRSRCGGPPRSEERATRENVPKTQTTPHKLSSMDRSQSLLLNNPLEFRSPTPCLDGRTLFHIRHPSFFLGFFCRVSDPPPPRSPLTDNSVLYYAGGPLASLTLAVPPQHGLCHKEPAFPHVDARSNPPRPPLTSTFKKTIYSQVNKGPFLPIVVLFKDPKNIGLNPGGGTS